MYPNREELYNPLLVEPLGFARKAGFVNYEEYYGRGMTAAGLTASEACDTARRFYCANSSPLCVGTCEQIKQDICFNNCTLWTGKNPGDADIRNTLCCTMTCPAPAGACAAGGGGGGMGTMLLIGAGLAAAVIIGLAVAGNTKKMVLVARPQPTPRKAG